MTITVEFRLYYTDNGDVLCYTCESLEGNYIVIDSQTYAECRNDLKVIDGRIVKYQQAVVISKLVHGIEGVTCPIEDVNIISDSEYTGLTTNWKVKLDEFRHC